MAFQTWMLQDIKIGLVLTTKLLVPEVPTMITEEEENQEEDSSDNDDGNGEGDEGDSTKMKEASLELGSRV